MYMCTYIGLCCVRNTFVQLNCNFCVEVASQINRELGCNL